MKKPSISELLDVLNKPALLYWANNLGLKGIKLNDYRKKSSHAGTSLHQQIKDYLEKQYPFTVSAHQRSFDEFIRDKNILAIEETMETEWFTGRCDIRLRIDKTDYVCDFKSSPQIYFEQKLQLAAYRMAYPDHLTAIIQIPEFIFKPLDIADYTGLEKIIKCLVYIHKTKKNYV